MKERIEKLIDALVSKRDGLLDKYLGHLEAYAGTEAGPQPQGLESVNMAGLIHDLDRHITNLHQELRLLKLSQDNGGLKTDEVIAGTKGGGHNA